jgi:hypothetical protein
MDSFDKYSRYTPLIIHYLLSNVVDDFQELKNIDPQVFLFKNSSSEEDESIALAPLNLPFLQHIGFETWHKVLKSMFDNGLKDMAEGFIVVFPTESIDHEFCLLYTAFNAKLQEGECFSHTLTSSEHIEVCRADCSPLGLGIELLFTPAH